MRSINAFTIGLLAVLALALGGSGNAAAGTFTMKQCEGAQMVDFAGSYSSINGSTKVDSTLGCIPSGSGKIGLYQDRSGGDLAYGAGGQVVWNVPGDLRVIGAEFAARLRDANGMNAKLVGFDGSQTINLDGGVAHDGNPHRTSWSNSSRPQTWIAAQLACGSISSCANLPSSPRAFLEATDVEFTVRDSVAPTLSASGELWSWAGSSTYHRGSASVKVAAADSGSGIAETWAEVNGLRVNMSAPACPGDKGGYSTRFNPCPAAHTATRTFDSAAAPFQQGENQVRFCARDYATTPAQALTACTPIRQVLIDSEAPNPPVNLRTDEGSGWQPDNGFRVRWDIPAGQKSPIIGALYLLNDLENGEQVGAGYFEGDSIQSAGPIEVPEVGAYTLTIALVDGAINLGHPANTVVRFDDGPPGDISPEPATGWISRDELPLEQEVERAEAGGPSGISGYALSVSRDGPARPCESPVCLAPELTLSGGADHRSGSVGALAEGDHWISAVAVSGARLSSREPGSTMVKVDRTPPRTTLSGVPGSWVNHPVTLTAEAEDDLSGMFSLPGDDGHPNTVIHSENHAPYSSPGPRATFVVAAEGVNRVRYWAEDLAGNANDGLTGPSGDLHPAPGQAVVRIDTTPPEITFDPGRSPEDPELVTLAASDADSGLASARISFRKVGSGGDWEPLETSGGEGRYQARIPSDDLPRGAYEVRGEARDRAGNEATGNQTGQGGPMVLDLPLKQPVHLNSSLSKGKKNLRVGYGFRRFVSGRLTSRGAAVSNQAVRIVESLENGSRPAVRSRTVRTDGDGRFRSRITAGPSRRIATFFDGTRQLARTAAPGLRLRVKGRVRLRIKPRRIHNGGAVRMKGSVGTRGALRLARGKLVAIQYLDPARRKWRPVEVLRTTRRGLFRYSYRFRTISSAQRIRFRAIALPEAGWPYLPSTSGPRSVIVYPKG